MTFIGKKTRLCSTRYARSLYSFDKRTFKKRKKKKTSFSKLFISKKTLSTNSFNQYLKHYLRMEFDEIFKTTEINEADTSCIKGLSCGIFIDTSGSTNFTYNAGRVKYIDIEMEIANAIIAKIPFTQIVSWSNSACVGFSNMNSGTCPSSIFDREDTKNVFLNSDIIVFLTDGEIFQGDVERFAKQIELNGAINKKLIMCGLICPDNGENNNISVFAPLMNCPNVLCFHYEAGLYLPCILMSKGDISKTMFVGTYISLDKLGDIVISNKYAKIPKDHTICSEDGNKVLSMNIKLFIDMVNDINFRIEWPELEQYISQINWDIVLQYGKTTGKLSDIRNIVNKLKNIQQTYIKDVAVTKFEMPFSKARDELVEKIMILKEEKKSIDGYEESENEDIKILSQELRELINKARLEEHEFANYIRKIQMNSVGLWEEIKRNINDIEKSSYTLKDFVFSSNRAKRAQTIDDLISSGEIDELENVIVNENVPEIDCCIHMDKGSAVLWLNKPENEDDTMSDHCINFPLDSYGKLKKCIINNPVCADCAKGFISTTKRLKGKLESVYRVPMEGYIPLDFKNNSKFILYELSRILSFGKVLPHIKMLLLSIVDDFDEEWFSPYKSHTISELIHSIRTTSSFSEEGIKISMIDALKGLLNLGDSEAFYRQPIIATYRLLKFISNGNYASKDSIITMAKRRFSYFLVELITSIIKPHGESFVEQQIKFNTFIEKIYNTLFHTICGIPIQHTLKSVPYTDDKLKLFVNWGYNDLIKQLGNLANSLNIEPAMLINEEFLTSTLYGLTKIEEYDRPLKLFQELLKKNKFILDAEHKSTDDKSELIKIIDRDMFNYFEPELVVSPPYAFYNGIYSTPSKLFFLNDKEPLFNLSELKSKLKTMDMENIPLSLEKFSIDIQNELNKRMTKTWGSYIPNNHSAHTNMHRIVATILEEQYPYITIEDLMSNDDLFDEIIIACFSGLKKTKGKEGNIYDKEVHREFIYCIFNFCDVRQREGGHREFAPESMYYKNKVKRELTMVGVHFNESGDAITSFDDVYIETPKLLQEIYSELNVEAILLRVENKYNLAKSKASDKKEKDGGEMVEDENHIVECHYPDIIEIKTTGDIDYDKWSDEQKIIVDKINPNDCIDFNNIKYYAGCDISFSKTNENNAVACFTVFNAQTHKLKAVFSVKCNTTIPYKAGYLAFREVPILLELLNIVNKEHSELMPELIIFDGNGIWHPRGCGLATHASILTGIPCFGVAKNVLVLPDKKITKDIVYSIIETQAPNKGDMIDICGSDGIIVGTAFNVVANPNSAIYISTGSGISLETAKDLTYKITKYSVVEPVRQADIISRKILAEFD